MAIYETGGATDVLDLLSKLRSFAISSGFTVNYFGARTAVSGQALQLTKGDVSGSFLGEIVAGASNDPGPNLMTYCHNAYNAANGTENQAAGSIKTRANAMLGAFQAYHFFANGPSDPPYLYVCVETAPGIYKHAGIGQLRRVGAITTGVFNFACRWHYDPNYISSLYNTRHSIPFDCADDSSRLGSGTQIRADSDGITPRWYDSYFSGQGNRFTGGFRTMNNGRATVQPLLLTASSGMTGRGALIPCYVGGERLNFVYSPLGIPPGIRWCRLDNVPPGHIRSIGGVQWKLFPIIRKDGTAGQPNSEVYGYAYQIN
ncbi:hypothetical protein [Lysobacter sp. CA199]|uniref:hypothetical protein n=1 Tax=Lysobacter sp. CA199 TaxID=3455608 RepID=UPI003F8D4E08